ncbi:aldehyde dehydrogenase family protein, partial [Streptomyces smaragdinus]|uniref:aldehyde dehydrogenase family protein n=1 Tax=Streptomyces smaragdinus TaxID=2585196 RepID=UPI001297EA89
EDASRAVASSRRAFDEGPWPRMKRAERAAAIHRLADVMEAHAEELAVADTTNMGKPLAQARHDVGRSVHNFRFFADHQRDHVGAVYPMDTGHHAYSEFGPAGVVTAISPWNFPLMMATWKIAPAIAWGNTCIIKPSEDTPASVTMLGRLAIEAELPPGVLNVVNGYGNPAGSALVADERVDRVTFTGSSATGKHVMAGAAGHLAPVSLELGGKGANIVFDDADIDNAVHWAVEAIFRNSGQICLAGSRLFVQSGIYDEFMKRFVAAAEALTIGDPFDPSVRLSSLASRRHFEKVSAYVSGIPGDGGKIVTGGVDESGRW